jgi:hypothetical protein
MVQTRRQEQREQLEARQQAVFGNPDLLALVVTHVSAVERRITLPLLSRAWQAAAAAAPVPQPRVGDRALPLWHVQRIWAQVSKDRRGYAAMIAAAHGQTDSLAWMRGAGLEWHAQICIAAAGGGQLGILKWLRSQDPPCPWDEHTCGGAALNGHLAVLQWARQQDPPCPWDDWTCSSAAENGHLAVLQWLRQQDPPCPWDSHTCNVAAENGHLAVLRWLRQQDPPCPWSKAQCCSVASWEGHQDVIDFITGSRVADLGV